MRSYSVYLRIINFSLLILFCSRQLPSSIKMKYSTGMSVDKTAVNKRKGKSKEGETDDVEPQVCKRNDRHLTTLDIFAGCGGLSEGLQQSGINLFTASSVPFENQMNERDGCYRRCCY